MKIAKIEIKNYRLLQDFAIDIQDNLSLVVGKNNTGKTSLVSILEKFLIKGGKFTYNDFCTSLRDHLKELEDGTKSSDEIKIVLNIYVEYNEDDNLKNIPILNLSPTENTFILNFEYRLEKEQSILLVKDYKLYKEQHRHDKDILYFLERNHDKYFTTHINAIDAFDGESSKKLLPEEVRKIINIQTISARRGVANSTETGEFQKTNSALSKLSHDYFKNTDDPNATDRIELQDALVDADDKLTKGYENAFKDVVASIKKFSNDASGVKIKSTLDSISLLKDNSSVVYDTDESELPEDHNGLGYMNLFAILFKLHIIFDAFKKTYSPTEDPADINLLFIEEPEAHTHPQMQYTFIKNVKALLEEQRIELKNSNLQTIISTHSAHITSQADFDDIKYFLRRPDEKNIIVKNLSQLKVKGTASPEEQRAFRFLKQYLTLHKSELFFADKIVFLEGDTERILLPAIMKKLDFTHKDDTTYTPLLSQNISIVDVGANSQIFESLISFLEIKTLIVTDIDSVKPVVKPAKDGKGKDKTVNVTCPVDEGVTTSNASIQFYIGKNDVASLTTLDAKNRVLSKVDDSWKMVENGQVYLTYQTSEVGYCGRSFEDSFLNLNVDFVKLHIEDFTSLKNKDDFEESPLPSYFELATCIANKPGFAIEVLLNSKDDFTDWHTPQYIEEGLVWLAKQ